ncbi:MAG: hypothetical protein AAFR20_09110 [Pseudomonadota bacterium]
MFNPTAWDELNRQDAAAHVSLPQYSLVKEPHRREPVNQAFTISMIDQISNSADKKPTLPDAATNLPPEGFFVCGGRQDRVGEAWRYASN